MKKTCISLMAFVLLLTGCEENSYSSITSETSSEPTSVTITTTTSAKSSSITTTAKPKESTAVRFTNKHDGVTENSYCSYPGCPQKVAPSGDTCYCKFHSEKCLECGCYIDADAIYCMDCILKALG